MRDIIREKRHGIEERYKTAVKKNGRKEEKIDVAKKLLKQGIDVDVIIQTTGLTKDEIKEL